MRPAVLGGQRRQRRGGEDGAERGAVHEGEAARGDDVGRSVIVPSRSIWKCTTGVVGTVCAGLNQFRPMIATMRSM